MNLCIQLAEQFGQAIVSGNYEAAHALLTEEAQQTYSPAALQAEVADMIAYAESPLERALVEDELLMEDWPDKQAGDLAWVYVSLEGESFSEAVSVIIAAASEGPRIRGLEWGRP